MLHDIAHYTKLLHIMPYVTYLQFPHPQKKPTPPRFNLEPENDGFQRNLLFQSFPGTSWNRFHVEFRGCTPPKPSHFFLTSPRFQPKNGPRDVDKALMQKINSVGCASFHLREVAETTFFGGVEICGRKEHPRVFGKVWKVP